MRSAEDKNDEKKAMEDTEAPAKRRRPIFRRRWTITDLRASSGVLSMHLLCLLAPFQFNWSAFWVAFGLYVIAGLFGFSISFHRNLSHKSFKLPKWLEYTFAYIGLHNLEGDPIDWVSTHRYHHQFSDTDRDPHTPTQGFWFSYITWAFDSYYLTEKVSPKNLIDFEETEANRKVSSYIFTGHLKHGRPNNVEDLQSQPFYRFLRETYVLHFIAIGLVLYAMGGLPFVVWGMGVRSVCHLHTTFALNSINHMWGTQSWNTGDLSTNNWVLGFLAFGEGWHNNHHAFAYSARHGLEWWQLDIAWWVIIFLEAVGLATDVKYPSQLHMQRLTKNPIKPKPKSLRHN